MNIVPVRAHSQPTSGHARTSDFATKREGTMALIAKMSSHETWFATIMRGRER